MTAAEPDWLGAARAAADRLREEIEAPRQCGERSRHEEHVSTARAVLGREAFERAWRDGRTLTQEQAIALALERDDN